MDTTALLSVSLQHHLPASEGANTSLLVKLAKGLAITRPKGLLLTREWHALDSDITVNPASTQGNFNEVLNLMGIYGMAIVIRKTAATSSGTLNITSDHFGISKTLTISDSTGVIGDSLGLFLFGVKTYTTGTNVFVLDFTSRVGFEVDIVITGEYND